MSGGKLPEGWVDTPLENIVEILDSMRIPVNNKERQKRIEGKDFNKLYPYYGATGEVGKIDDFIFDEELIALGEDGVSFFDGQKNKAYMLYGKTWVNNHAHVLKAIQGLSHNKFLCYFLNQFDYHDYVNGGTRLKLTQANMRKIPVRFAPFSEQKIIAEKLDTLLAQVDSTKARLEQIPQILKRFRQAVLTVAMSGGLTEEWRKSNSILFSSWVNSSIGELAQVATGKTPKRTEVKYWENGSIPWLTSSSTGEIYTEVAEQFITPIALKECTLKIFSPGTLLLAMYGEGKTRGQVTELKIHAACNQACAAIICDKEKIDLQFLKMRLMENYQETRKAAAGGNQPNLNLNKVREIPVIVPPLPEQAEIVRRVEQLFAYADTIEKQVNSALTRVNSLTQSILAKAFRGELTAQWRAENPSLISGENSAAALLERIKAERAASSGKKNSRKKA
ncbi:restriction endonuclease subunit S [Cronobacter sakazakii]|uniref:restriction endonuclease subunit S n=1 Tax=Enterobacter sp. K16B TaxID=2878537 RepID=UPI001CDA3DF1|nr:restriction endonuclease subunit S [Enterobacter sp. K16B]ELY2860999.1 restriction endonuclease subunit S [Cronobacter sakazakii]MCA2028523.1 restriction endonuclease subunit S [Enterobacter sp. K16B]